MRLTLMKWHIWLGWIAGVPIILWVVSGLFMTIWPIEQVRGTHLRADPAPVVLQGGPPVFPRIDSAVRPVESVDLVQRPTGAQWIIRFEDGGGRRASVESGAYLAPQLTGPEARIIAEAAYAGEEPFASLERFDADNNPGDLRRGRPAWRATFGRSNRVYIDAETGDVLAVRTGLWRAFDFMWGLHIMDLQNREDTSHPILVGSAILALLMVLFGAIILPWRYWRKRRAKQQ